MPQVRSRTVIFDGKSYVRKTTVDKDGVFRIRLPLTARDILKCAEISAPTLKEVEELWDKKMREYKSARTVERKVIYYKLESNCDIGGPDPFESAGISFCEGVVIAVAAQVLTETKITYSNGEETYSYRQERSTLPDSMTAVDRSFHPDYKSDHKHVIDWTPEREAFFKELGEAIEQLILKMNSLLSDRKQLVKAIDSGTRALEFKDGK